MNSQLCCIDPVVAAILNYGINLSKDGGSAFNKAYDFALIVPVSPERGIFRPPPRSHLGETHANVACQCVRSATPCGHQLRVKPKVHEGGLR